MSSVNPKDARIMQLKEALKSVRAHFEVSKMIQNGKYDCDVLGLSKRIIDQALYFAGKELDFLECLSRWEAHDKKANAIRRGIFNNPFLIVRLAFGNLFRRFFFSRKRLNIASH